MFSRHRNPFLRRNLGDSYIRMSGSTRKMLPSLIQDRITMGRPPAQNPCCSVSNLRHRQELIGRSEELRVRQKLRMHF